MDVVNPHPVTPRVTTHLRITLGREELDPLVPGFVDARACQRLFFVALAELPPGYPVALTLSLHGCIGTPNPLVIAELAVYLRGRSARVKIEGPCPDVNASWRQHVVRAISS